MIDSEALAVGLGIFSAFTLALANLTVKASADILTVRVVLSMSCAAIVAPALFFVPLPSQDLIIALAISLPIHTAYQFAMIRALQSGDLSLVFPVMRGLAPLLVGIGGILILGETLSPLSTLGLVIATGAVISFGLLQGGGLKGLKHVNPRAMIWASLTEMAGGEAVGGGIQRAPRAGVGSTWMTLPTLTCLDDSRFACASFRAAWTIFCCRFSFIASWCACVAFIESLFASRCLARRTASVRFLVSCNLFAAARSSARKYASRLAKSWTSYSARLRSSLTLSICFTASFLEILTLTVGNVRVSSMLVAVAWLSSSINSSLALRLTIAVPRGLGICCYLRSALIFRLPCPAAAQRRQLSPQDRRVGQYGRR